MEDVNQKFVELRSSRRKTQAEGERPFFVHLFGGDRIYSNLPASERELKLKGLQQEVVYDETEGGRDLPILEIADTPRGRYALIDADIIRRGKTEHRRGWVPFNPPGAKVIRRT